MEGLREYIKLVSDSFDQKIRYINSFTRHSPTIGEWREYILREIIRQHTPKRFSVSSGFIYKDESNVSPQIDILIYDSTSFGPLFEFGGIVVVRPESAVCAIEIKSKLDKTGLYDSIKDSINIRKACSGTLVRCDLICFESVELNTLKDHILKYDDKDYIGYCLDSIHCISEKQYSLIWVYNRDKNIGRFPKKHPVFCELKKIYDDGKSLDSFYSFFLLLCDYLERVQGSYDKRFENLIYPTERKRKKGNYLDLFGKDFDINIEEEITLGWTNNG